jgi:hypothetical protein
MSGNEAMAGATAGLDSLVALQDKLTRVWRASVTETEAMRWHRLDLAVQMLGVKGGVKEADRVRWKVTTEELAARAALEAADALHGGVIPLKLVKVTGRDGAVEEEVIVEIPPPAPPVVASKPKKEKKEKAVDTSFMEQ